MYNASLGLSKEWAEEPRHVNPVDHAACDPALD
jgi:hypothetical protein